MIDAPTEEIKRGAHFSPDAQSFLIGIIQGNTPSAEAWHSMVEIHEHPLWPYGHDTVPTEQEAYTLFALSNLGIVHATVGKHHGYSPQDREDMINAGLYGLCEGMMRFKSDRGVVPVTYVYHRARQEVGRMAEGFRDIVVPSGVHARLPLVMECLEKGMNFKDILGNNKLAIALGLFTEKEWAHVCVRGKRTEEILMKAWDTLNGMVLSVQGAISLNMVVGGNRDSGSTTELLEFVHREGDDYDQLLTDITMEQLYTLLGELLVDSGAWESGTGHPISLTPSQFIQVFRLHLEGYSDSEVGRMYEVSGQTVANYLKKIFTVIESSEELKSLCMELKLS